MMKASEARVLTERAIELEVQTRQSRAEEFCEGLTEQIKKRCEERYSGITVNDISKDLYEYIINILKDNGYSVTRLNNNTIQLFW